MSVCLSIDYEPKERRGHCTVRVGDHLYMWAGNQPKLPEVHDSEKKRAYTSCVEVFDLTSGKWTQKQTTGNPPLGISRYSSVAIDNEIYYFGGYCGHPGCYHNSLYSLNVTTLNWKEHSPTTTAEGHPSKKCECAMIHVVCDGEDYLVVFGGRGPSEDNQPGAQYSRGYTNEVHYYSISSGKCIVYSLHVK